MRVHGCFIDYVASYYYRNARRFAEQNVGVRRALITRVTAMRDDYGKNAAAKVGKLRPSRGNDGCGYADTSTGPQEIVDDAGSVAPSLMFPSMAPLENILKHGGWVAE